MIFLSIITFCVDQSQHRRYLHDNKSHNWKVFRVKCDSTNNNPPLLAFPSSTSRNALETWEQVGLTKELSLDIVRLVRFYLALPLLCASDLVSEELSEGRFLCSSPSLSTIVRYVLVHGCTIFLCWQKCCLDDPCKGPSINDKDHLFGLLTRDVHTNNAFDQLRKICSCDTIIEKRLIYYKKDKGRYRRQWTILFQKIRM